MARTRPRSSPRPTRSIGNRIDPSEVDLIVDEVVLPLRRRAFVFDDPESYRAGVRDSAAMLREALEERSG